MPVCKIMHACLMLQFCLKQFFLSLLYSLFSVTNQGVLYFESPVTIRNHGTYQCDVPGCTKSYIGHLNVAGKIIINKL